MLTEMRHMEPRKYPSYLRKALIRYFLIKKNGIGMFLAIQL